ncbi:MAG: alpha/beta hydrolase [Bacteroidota bacterium]
MKEIEIYESLALQNLNIEDVFIGLRQIGKGKNLVFIHGFPTHGYTWRKIIPELSEYFKCHILDLPGLGDSKWTNKTDFNSKSQARYIIKLLEKIGVDRCSLIAHNSGATIARYIAVKEKEKVENLIILNTEIPNHRPPWIPFYQKIGLLPMVPTIIRRLLNQRWFIKSSMGFKELYTDKSMLDVNCNILPYINPVISSPTRTIGAFKYLKGIDWELVDKFKDLHKEIRARTLFIWGESDKTFPIKLGKQMLEQFSTETQFITIKNASLLPHEEKPYEVISAILNFVKKDEY